MAIEWGAWEDSGGNGMRVGIDVTWEAISHSETVATATVKYYTENRYGYSDNQTLSLGGSIGGSIGFSNNQGGEVTLRGTRTYDYTYSASSYGTSPGSKTFSASLSGAYNGVTPSKSVTKAIPARPIAAPAAVTSAAASRVSDTVTRVSWVRHATAGEPYTTMWAYQSTNGGAFAAVTTNISGSVSSWDRATVANTKYRFRIYADNSAGTSPYDETGDIFTTPAAPSNCVRTPSGADQVVTWTNKTGYTEYQTEVWRSVNGVWSLLATKSSGVTSHTDVAPSSADRIKYRVRHKTTAGSQPVLYSVNSNETSETAGVTIPPLAPTNLDPSGGENVDPSKAITLSWKHNHGGDSAPQSAYELQYRVNGGSWTNTGAVTSTTQSRTIAADTFASTDAVEWQVKTKGADATYSPWSSIASFTAIRPRKIPTQVDFNTGHVEADASGFDWTAATLQNSWVDYGGAWETAAFCRRAGVTYLRGLIKNGTVTSGTTIMVLPVGYRPSAAKHFACVSNNAVCTLQVYPNGDVKIGANANATWVSLANISFPSELS